MARRYDTISVLSDYGTDDEFAGVLRAVLRDLAPDATVIDLTHGIAPYDVRGGSLALARSIAYVPVGIVMAIVDPGVATERRAIAVEVAGGDAGFGLGDLDLGDDAHFVLGRNLLEQRLGGKEMRCEQE